MYLKDSCGTITNRLIEERERETEISHTLTVTVAEVYNEQIRDLLVSPGQQVNAVHLKFLHMYILPLVHCLLPQDTV